MSSASAARPLEAVALAPPPAMNSVTLSGAGVWLVTGGQVDVFATMIDERLGFGRRHHMFRLPAGSVLFGLPAAPGVRVDAVCTATGRIEPTSRERIDTGLAEADTAPGAQKAIDRWINRLCEFAAPGLPPNDTLACDEGADIRETDIHNLRPVKGVAWIEILAGGAELFGRDGAAIAPPDVIAISKRAWLRSTTASHVRFMSGRGAAQRGLLWQGLDVLHGLVMDDVCARLAAAVAAECDRHAAKAVLAADANADALTHIAAAFLGSDEQTATAAEASGTSATARLHIACRLVATRAGVPFTAPAAAEYRTIRDGVATIARVSKFRTRQVRLDDGWWRGEQGPLLGFLKDDSQPIALLPRRRSGYELVDAPGSAGRVVDAAVAATLAPIAYTFYRPFPAGPVGFTTLVRFGAAGCQRELRAILVTGLLIGLVGMALPIATGILIDTIIPSTDRTQLGQWIAILLVCTAATALFQVTRSVALIRLEMKMAYAVQAAVWDRLISLPARFFRDSTAGELATRTNGLETVRETLSGAAIRAILGGVFSVFNFGLLFFYSTPLALAGTALILIAVAIFATIAHFQRAQRRDIAVQNSKLSGVVLQLLTGIRKLRVAGAEMRALETWARLFSRGRRARLRVNTLTNGFSVFQTVYPLVTYFVLFSVVMQETGDGTRVGASIRTGGFLAFLAAFIACLQAMLTTAGAAIEVLAIVPEYELAKPILIAEPEVGSGHLDPGPLKGAVALDHVTFRYRADGPPTLNDVTCHIKPGEFVAFVGPSGSGKSTILRLLLGFEKPESGAVFYDRRDLADLDLHAVRRQIGAVLQSGRLMPGDMFTNIVGCSSATLEDAWTASRWAGLEEDIKQMPMGMQTMITDGGASLSGGQRQRLMIARAIVSRPNVLLFDEATSALDNQTQAMVSHSLERLRATRIVIAHRLSSIVNADRIVVVDKGRIVQSGTYAELIAQPGLFHDLASRQVA